MATVAFLLADGYEDSEFRRPYEAVLARGHATVVVGENPGKEVTGKRGEDRALIDASAADARAIGFDALVIAGGHAPDELRLNADVVALVAQAMVSARPVAAICHGPQLLIEAEALHGRTVTSSPSVRKDIENAGATWVDREVVEDGNLLTSRTPDDLDAFCESLLARLE